MRQRVISLYCSKVERKYTLYFSNFLHVRDVTRESIFGRKRIFCAIDVIFFVLLKRVVLQLDSKIFFWSLGWTCDFLSNIWRISLKNVRVPQKPRSIRFWGTLTFFSANCDCELRRFFMWIDSIYITGFFLFPDSRKNAFFCFPTTSFIIHLPFFDTVMFKCSRRNCSWFYTLSANVIFWVFETKTAVNFHYL